MFTRSCKRDVFPRLVLWFTYFAYKIFQADFKLGHIQAICISYGKIFWKLINEGGSNNSVGVENFSNKNKRTGTTIKHLRVLWIDNIKQFLLYNSFFLEHRREQKSCAFSSFSMGPSEKMLDAQHYVPVIKYFVNDFIFSATISFLFFPVRGKAHIP